MTKFNLVCLFVCLIGLQALLSAAYDERDLDQTDLQCLEELNFDKSIVLNNYDKNDFIIEGNPQMNKFYACAWKKDNLQNADGSINLDNLQKMVEIKLQKLFPDSPAYRNYLTTESTKDCKSITGKNNGDTCVKIYNCILRKIGEVSEKVKPEDILD